MSAKTDGMVIHAHDTMPPVLTTEPASYAGTVGMYWDATPAGAAEALDYHRRYWSDWQPDEEVVRLANR